MTRIIAIVVVIFAAVVAYMYTSAGDVEVGETPTASEPAGEDDAALVAEEGVEGEEGVQELDDTVPAEVAEEEAEAELIEGAEGVETEVASEAEVLDDTAEPVPAEEGPADEEPEAGVGTVSTEEETDGAGAEGITAEEGEQEGLPGEAPEGEAVEEAVVEEGDEPLETPEGLDTSVDGAPEAVIPGEQTEEAETATETAEQVDEEDPTTEGAAIVATEDDETEAVTEDVGPAVIVEEDAGAATTEEVGSAIRSDVTGGAGSTADLDTLLDPENLDVEVVVAAIEDSDLEAERQTQLIEALETAQDSPALLPGVLDRIRTALLGE